MIKINEEVPHVYYNMSRDFQVFGRAMDIVLNYNKTNIDLVKNLSLSDNTYDLFLTLLSSTLGFKPKHEYDIRQLRAICSVLSKLLKNKGTTYAIETAVQTIIKAENINQITVLHKENTEIYIFVPTELSNLYLLEDLLDYLLPAGITIRIIQLKIYSSDEITPNESDLVTVTNDVVWYTGNLQNITMKYNEYITGKALKLEDIKKNIESNSTHDDTKAYSEVDVNSTALKFVAASASNASTKKEGE